MNQRASGASGDHGTRRKLKREQGAVPEALCILSASAGCFEACFEIGLNTRGSDQSGP